MQEVEAPKNASKIFPSLPGAATNPNNVLAESHNNHYNYHSNSTAMIIDKKIIKLNSTNKNHGVYGQPQNGQKDFNTTGGGRGIKKATQYIAP